MNSVSGWGSLEVRYFFLICCSVQASILRHLKFCFLFFIHAINYGPSFHAFIHSFSPPPSFHDPLIPPSPLVPTIPFTHSFHLSSSPSFICLESFPLLFRCSSWDCSNTTVTNNLLGMVGVVLFGRPCRTENRCVGFHDCHAFFVLSYP